MLSSEVSDVSCLISAAVLDKMISADIVTSVPSSVMEEFPIEFVPTHFVIVFVEPLPVTFPTANGPTVLPLTLTYKPAVVVHMSPFTNVVGVAPCGRVMLAAPVTPAGAVIFPVVANVELTVVDDCNSILSEPVAVVPERRITRPAAVACSLP